MELINHVREECVFSLPRCENKAPIIESQIFEGGNLPKVIFPVIHAIHSDSITRNKTYYPEKTLMGDKKDQTGVYSFTYPYRKPWIENHQLAPGMFGGKASEIYGRTLTAKYVKDPSIGTGYIEAVPYITHPAAIEAILTERWLTNSVGNDTTEVWCSVCEALGEPTNLSEERCEHQRGELYKVGKKMVECYWKIGPIKNQETSFVPNPSDVFAGVRNKNLSPEEVKLLVPKGTDFDWLTDLATGESVSREFIGLDQSNFAMIEEMSLLSGNFGGIWTSPTLSILVDGFKESSDEDTVLTLGELYSLAEDDEEFSIESAITTKQRKALSPSSFCGDKSKREFPAHDAAHVKSGFSMLARYKGSTPKTKIHSCLLRKAKEFGVEHDSKNCPYCQGKKEACDLWTPIVFVDPKARKTYELESISHCSSKTAAETYKYLTHMEGLTTDERQLALEAIEKFDAGESPEVVKVELTKENFGAIYGYIEHVLESSIKLYGAAEESINKAEDMLSESAMECSRLKLTLTEKEVELANTDEKLDKLTDMVESLTDAVKPKEEELKEEPKVDEEEPSKESTEEVTEEKPKEACENKDDTSGDNTEGVESDKAGESLESNPDIEQLKSELEVLRAENAKLKQNELAALAREAAMLRKQLKKPGTKDKSIDEIATELTKRSVESLKDSIADLNEELGQTETKVDYQNVEKVENPVKTTPVEKNFEELIADKADTKSELLTDLLGTKAAQRAAKQIK